MKQQDQRYIGAVKSVRIDDLDKTDKEILPMVLNLANKYQNEIVSRDQLVAAGLYGVAQAQMAWTPARGVLLSTLAFNFVRGRMLDLLRVEHKYAARYEVTDPVAMPEAHVSYEVEAHIERKQLLAQCTAIINRECTDVQKQALRWHLDGISNAAIAEHLCLPASTIETLIEKALNTLRVRLGVKTK